MPPLNIDEDEYYKDLSDLLLNEFLIYKKIFRGQSQIVGAIAESIIKKFFKDKYNIEFIKGFILSNCRDQNNKSIKSVITNECDAILVTRHIKILAKFDDFAIIDKRGAPSRLVVFEIKANVNCVKDKDKKNNEILEKMGAYSGLIAFEGNRSKISGYSNNVFIISNPTDLKKLVSEVRMNK